MSRTALVIMAAGMASRYGGNKQIDGMGPHGEILMEYSIMDAIRAGFTKVVFIIKPEMQERMGEICGKKYENRIDVRYAFQDFSTVPGGVPAGRVKPYGTVHAVLCARAQVEEPFAVINADDYYGVESFAQMHAFLEDPHGAAGMMGYRLKNTVSAHGTVTRGICRVEDGWLTGVREVKRIGIDGDGRILNEENGEKLDPESPVSMNFWGFGREIFGKLETRFERFVREMEEGDVTSEYLLPVAVDEMVEDGELSVKVLPTGARWFGVTYQEDRPKVIRELSKLHEMGMY